MKTINYDREEFRAGESIYGEQFQIQIDEKRINEPEYYYLVKIAMEKLKKKTTEHRKENTIVYHNRRQERIDRLSRVVLTIRHTEDNRVEPVERYNKWLINVIKKNEKERNNLVNIGKMLAIK